MSMAALLLLPVLLLLTSLVDAFPANCSSGTCGDQDVHYPFWLNSSESDCGYPGLGLACEEDTTLILNVHSHRYRVVRIDYAANTVAVSDAEVDDYEAGCPRLHLNLTLDYASSWLQLTSSDSNITFLYNCKKNVSWSLSSAQELSGCRGEYDNKQSYVLPDAGITGAEAYEYECEKVVVAPVLGVHKDGMMDAPGAPPPANRSFGGVVWAGFELKYNTHSEQCDRCEKSRGWCGYQRNESASSGLRFSCYCDDGPTTDRCAMALLLRHRLPLPAPLLLAFLLAASSHGAPPGNESYDPSLCLREFSTCGNVRIKYPFYFYNKTADILGNPVSYCGYPGLGIQCEDSRQAFLEIGSEKYNVSDINYTDFTISVVDPDAISGEEMCPGVDHNVTLPQTSWLTYSNETVDYLVFFLNCDFIPGFPRLPNMSSITCQIFGGSMGGLSFVLLRDDVPAGDWPRACKVFEVPILKSLVRQNPYDDEWRDGGYGKALRTGFQLKWEQNNSSCNQCERSKGQCAYNHTMEFGDDNTTSTCQWQPYFCGAVNISYPVYLSNATEPYCGYPGMAVGCDGGSKALLRLGADNYTVSRIDYDNLTVSLANTGAAAASTACPIVDHNVTIPADLKLYFPSAVDYIFLFLGCSFGQSTNASAKPPKPPSIKPITCGDKGSAGANSSFVIPRAVVPPGDWPRACRAVFEVPVLKDAIPLDAQDSAWRSDGYGAGSSSSHMTLLLPCLLFFLGVHVPASHDAHLPSTYDGSICSKSFRCGGVEISYPFYLANATQAIANYGVAYSCGYTDLEILCQGVGKTDTAIIQLGQYSYTVKDISYDKHHPPRGCRRITRQQQRLPDHPPQRHLQPRLAALHWCNDR
ncbi:hypothetical protein EJB05_55252, partial [Eragrostis curvula]